MIASLREGDQKHKRQSKRRIAFFGHFGINNFGNDATLSAILWNLRRVLPDAEFSCICTEPEIISARHKIAAFPVRSSRWLTTAWKPKNAVTRLLRLMFLGIPNELNRWYTAFRILKRTDALIVPGTGLLNDTFDIMSGPYHLFKWSVAAKLGGCKVFFISVGAGPLNSVRGKFFAKSALALAKFRSYRDVSSADYLKSVGFYRRDDRIYPDLVFSLPAVVGGNFSKRRKGRLVVGLGLMRYSSEYTENTSVSTTYDRYVESLLSFVKWLLERNYDVRLLIGEVGDPVEEFFRRLNEGLPGYDSGRIIYEQPGSVEQLNVQIADTDLVVATRFHNAVFALLSNKPTISISFHHKCVSLMNSMGLSEYCLDIVRLSADDLIAKVLDVEKNFNRLKSLIADRTDELRFDLEEQYRLIVGLV
jgi:polysaccharide pyruvyl transferase WcaK-like protein